MKKTCFALCLLLAFVLLFCVQSFAATPEGETPPTVVAMKTFAGKVDNVNFADPSRGKRLEITVVDPTNNKKITFYLDPQSKIFDANGKEITVDKVKKDNYINVEYTTTKDGCELGTVFRVQK